MEEGGSEALGIEPPLRQYAGYRERMRDIGLTGLAKLTLVRLFRKSERALD